MLNQVFPRYIQTSRDIEDSPVSKRAISAGINFENDRLIAQGININLGKIIDGLAFRKIIYAVISTLFIAGIKYRWLDKITNRWYAQTNNRVDNEGLRAKGLSWKNGNKDRTLIFNLTVPLVKNNVDLCLFNSSPDNLDETNAKSYIALGELKGGIDPAGADEHWKTARSALERIRKSFAKIQLNPHIFFIGAAIEKKMATEIWNELQNGILTNAANLNEENQLASISHWLCNL